jgi:hypothetical protein
MNARQPVAPDLAITGMAGAVFGVSIHRKVFHVSGEH